MHLVSFAMESARDAANFRQKLEKLLPLFEGGDPDPLSFRQKRQFEAWKALLNSGPADGNSRTRAHRRKKARSYALKVNETAGRETLLLCILVYSISGLPKIVFPRFYRELREWSQRVQFPEPLVDQASKLWDEPGQQILLQRGSSPQPPDTGNTSLGQTIAEAALPSCKIPTQENIKHETNFLRSKCHYCSGPNFRP